MVLAAFALRVYRLDYQEMRGDETFGFLFSAQSLPEILEETVRLVEPHPPLDYFLLHFWRDLAGQSEFALRFHSLFFGVLAVPLVYALAKTLWGAEVGLWAAGLLTINPYQIWHAQEARMYAISTVLCLASSLLFIRALREGGRLRWFAYVAFTTVSIYTHYYALFIVLFQALFWLTFWREHRSEWRAWLTSQLVILVFYIPWLAAAWRVLFVYHGNGDSPTFLEMLRRCALAFSLGQSIDPGTAVYLLPLLSLLFAAGLWYGSRQEHRALAFLILYLAVPVLSIYLSSLRRPVFNERYLAAATPPCYILLAMGIVGLRRQLAGRWVLLPYLVALLVLAGNVYSLHGYYFWPAYSKSRGWRDLANRLEALGHQGDIILQNYADPTLWYYYQGDLPHAVLPASRPVDEEAAVAELQRLADSYKRIWFIPQQAADWDATGFVGKWLYRHCDRVEEESVGHLHLELYLTPQTFLAEMEPSGADLGHKVKLLGHRIEAKGPEGDETLSLKPGWPLYLTVYWRALSEMETSYTVFTHFLGPEGDIQGQKDNLPVRGTYPTTEWKAGETIVDKYVIITASDAPPGEYLLELGLYDRRTGQRLPLLDEGGRVRDERIVLSRQIRME